jgi:hypothetical protein
MAASHCATHLAPVQQSAGCVTMGEIARRFGAALRTAVCLLPQQRKVLAALCICRTAALGGHLQHCRACGRSTPVFNSCRNRHCPSCQSFDQARWLHARRERILPVPYFHVVFTLPSQLRPIARHNPKRVYALLFRAATETLLTLAAHPRYLGAVPAITAVLHTWARDLSYHVHLHCIVSAGGLSPDGSTWIAAPKPNYLFPVRVLGALFRGKFLDGLDRWHRAGKLRMPTRRIDQLDRLRDRLHRMRWLVYAKAPFGGAEQLFAYLGRYTHRVGISNPRLESLGADGQVTFRTKHGARETLAGQEFLRRFLQHVLPHGFVKIRHSGLLAPANVRTRLVRARELLPATAPRQHPGERPQNWVELLLALCGTDVTRCPRCSAIAVVRLPLCEWARVEPIDTS